MLAQVEGEEITEIDEFRREDGVGFGGDMASSADGFGPGPAGAGLAQAGGGSTGSGEVEDYGETQPEADPPPETDDGEDYAPDGTLVGRHHSVRHPRKDGSVEYDRTDWMVDGSTAEIRGSRDAAGNESYTMRTAKADGTSLLTTRTTGADGSVTDHTTWFDASGQQTDDETFYR